MSSPQSLTRPDEATWIARVRDGDERALAEIFTAYHASLCGLAASYVGDAAQAEEIVQETFLAFWERRRTADIRSGVRVYLFAAVRNRALNVVRHAKYERALTLRSWDGDMPGMGRAPRETESMERATSAPWPAAWAIGPTRLSRSRSSDGRGSLPVSTALTFCHILVALCVLPSMDGKIEAHNQRSAAVWSSGGDQYDEISRQIASALDHCVRRVDPRPGEQVLDGRNWHRLDLATGRAAWRDGHGRRYRARADRVGRGAGAERRARHRLRSGGRRAVAISGWQLRRKALAGALDAERRLELRRDFISFHERFNTDLGIAVPRGYLLTIGRRR